MNAVKAMERFVAAKTEVGAALHAEATATAGDYDAAKRRVEAALAEQRDARTEAQNAIKEACGYYPFELQVMGL